MKTIQELCVNVVVVENEKKAHGKVYSTEEKKALSTTFKLLFTKDELREGFKFCLEQMNNAWDLSYDGAVAFGEKCTWTPKDSVHYTVTNIIMYCLGMKTFKECQDNEWFEYMMTLIEEYMIPQNW
jgi:hypothetical protein|nr:MAG TPA: hypothetical protein [Caudoviricetes sp.]